MKRKRRNGVHEVDWHVLLLQTGIAARDVPEVMQLEEGVDVVNEHKEQLVVTAERDAERTERRRDGSSQSDLGAISCPMPSLRGRWFKAS